MLGPARQGQAAAAVGFLGAISGTAVLVLEGRGLHRVVPLVLCAVVFFLWRATLSRWRNLVSVLLLVILFIPMGRYSLPGNLPFKLEPYRIAVAALTLVWVLAMLVDRRVRLRRSVLDAPLMMILFTTFVSDLVNVSRVRPMTSDVIKAQTFFISFFIVFYIVVSLVRTRKDLMFLVRLLAGGGGVIAISAVIERRTGYNVFNHLSQFFPVLHFDGASAQFRSGRLRVLASSEHPIALSVLFVILLPLVIYLAHCEGRKWMFIALVYVVAIFTTASRTGIIGLLVVTIVYLCLQPRALLRRWPLVIPMLAAVHIAAPGALGTIKATMSPSGMLAEQSAVTVGDDAYGSGRLTDVRPTLAEWSNKPLLGEGFGTRVTTGANANSRLLDDQWLGTLLEVGYFGYIAWLWLFVRSIRRLARNALAEGDSDDGWLLTGFAAAISAFAMTMGFYDTFSFVQNVFLCFILSGLAASFLAIRAAEADPALEDAAQRSAQAGAAMRALRARILGSAGAPS